MKLMNKYILLDELVAADGSHFLPPKFQNGFSELEGFRELAGPEACRLPGCCLPCQSSAFQNPCEDEGATPPIRVVVSPHQRVTSKWFRGMHPSLLRRTRVTFSPQFFRMALVHWSVSGSWQVPRHVDSQGVACRRIQRCSEYVGGGRRHP